MDQNRHIHHVNAPFARNLGRLVRATIDENHGNDVRGTSGAAILVYEIVEWHAMRIAREMGIDSGEFAIRLFQALATDVKDLDRIATQAELAAEEASYQRTRMALLGLEPEQESGHG